MTGLISVPKLYLQRFMYSQRLGQCVLYGYFHPTYGFSMILNASDKVIGVGSMLSLIGCNCVLIINYRNRSLRNGCKHARRPPQKLTLIAVLVMLVFLASVLPYLTLKMIFNINKSLFLPPIHPWAMRAIVGSYVLMHVSSNVNPVLYVLQGFRPQKLRGIRLSLRILASAGGCHVGSVVRIRRRTVFAKSSVSSISNPDVNGSKDKMFILRRQRFCPKSVSI